MRNRLLFLLTLFISLVSEAQTIVIQSSTPDISLNNLNAKIVTIPAHIANQIELKKQAKLIWLRIIIDNQTEETFLLEGLSPHTKHIHVWAEQNQGIISHQQAGRDTVFAKRWLAHKNFTFPLPNEIGKYTLWIAIDSPQEGDIAFKIRSFKFFSEYAFWEYFFLGIYYGLMLIACVYNVFLFLKSKIRLHLYYALYIVGCILLSFREDGLGFQFFWPYFPNWNEALVFHLAKPIFLITFLLYSIAFLGLRKQVLIVKLLSFLSIAYLIGELLAFAYPSFISVTNWMIALVSIVVYISSLRQIREDVYSRYFAIGFSMVIISLVINLLRSFSIIPSNIFTVYSFNYGIFLEVVIFSIALAERVKGIQDERNAALSKLVIQLNENDSLQKKLIIELEEKKELQEKVNCELEQKVQERTIELQTANNQLKDYAQKVDELNSALDLHNYSLKKEIKQSTLSRINVELVNYSKFLEIYPTEHQCLKTLETLKWPNGFVCNKCGNTHSSQSKFWYRHKCTKCGTIESVTAHTLYHNTRVPLQKAFYITYLTYVQSDKTLDEIAELIDLRKATVWLLRKKVEERMEQKPFQKLESWREMILDK
jgi:hypothetical protein